jgi:hypothetical protein
MAGFRPKAESNWSPHSAVPSTETGQRGCVCPGLSCCLLFEFGRFVELNSDQRSVFSDDAKDAQKPLIVFRVTLPNSNREYINKISLGYPHSCINKELSQQYEWVIYS